MKICAIVCEYNPFHNGHKYLIERARELSACDFILCIMSGSFTQRGEVAVSDKFTRAGHAVRGGADCVIQLPASFSVAPAEIFARGALEILSSIPQVKCLAFGCENDDKQKIFKAAEILAGEGPTFREHLKSALNRGESYKKSMAEALSACGAEGALASSPNSVLALEYVKWIIRLRADMDFIPVKRLGGGYSDGEIAENYSSAKAIRANLENGQVKGNLPEFVYDDIKGTDVKEYEKLYALLARYALLRADSNNMRRITGCSEGLENKLKSIAEDSEDIVAAATGRRYSSSRIRRILTSNMLGLYGDETNQFLKCGTYIKPLAVSARHSDQIFAALSRSSLPVVVKKNDLRALSKTALRCFEADEFTDRIRDEICGVKTYNYTVRII